MTVFTIPDSPKTTIVIDSEDHPMTPMEPILAPKGLQIAAESTRIFTQKQPPTSMEHMSSDDEQLAHKDEASQVQNQHTAPPYQKCLLQQAKTSPISSLDR